MEVKVVLVIEAGQSLKDFVQALIGGATVAAPAKTAAPVAAKAAVAAAPAPEAKVASIAPKAAVAATPAKAAAPAAKPAVAKVAPAKAAAPAPSAAVDFDSLDEDGQRAAIATHITRHSKKGKTADIKALLTAFGVTRGSELDPAHLAQFHDLMEQYGAGASVEDLLASMGGEEAEDLN